MGTWEKLSRLVIKPVPRFDNKWVLKWLSLVLLGLSSSEEENMIPVCFGEKKLQVPQTSCKTTLIAVNDKPRDVGEQMTL